MMRFTFTDNAAFLPDPNEAIYQLEAKVDKLHELPPHQQLSLLHTDATNYLNGRIAPFDAWYQKRIPIIHTYAGMDWLAFGQHLNQTSTMLGNLCTTIYRQLQELEATLRASPAFFSLPHFCSALAKIDQLWHIMLPSHLVGVNSPTVLALLAQFGVSAPPPKST